jgi:hypothetical protein
LLLNVYWNYRALDKEKKKNDLIKQYIDEIKILTRNPENIKIIKKKSIYYK